MTDAREPILAHRLPGDTVAFARGRPVPAARFVGDVLATAAALPPGRFVLNACEDRYAFAVAFCAALVAGRVSLLPGARTPAVLAALAARYGSVVPVADASEHDALAHACPQGIVVPPLGQGAPAWPPPAVPRARDAAIVFTSGSTGQPEPQLKHHGGLVDGARSEADALSLHGPDLAVLATVPPQHMYGLESSLLLALHGGFAFAAERPLHPAEVAAAAAALPARRVLVTTPVHLRALAASEVGMPALECVVCATAPLAPELAAECERRWATRLLEVYGCSETGMVATRRTTEGTRWHAMRDVRIEARDGLYWAGGGHVARPGVLADRLVLHDAATFELNGRMGDVVNIGGKRTSIAALDHALLSVPGVDDGAFFEMDAGPQAATAAHGAGASGRERRLAAVAATRTLDRARLLAALRERIDPVFLPRPLRLVEQLPRNALGKLPRAELLALARRAPRR